MGWFSNLFARDARPRKLEERRRFLRSGIAGGVVVLVALAGYVPVLRALTRRLRPPGALAEHEFLSACIKCGQCLQVCPVEAIKLGDAADGFGLGVPYIDARAQACDFSCDAVQCVLACPTGALSHKLSRKEESHMGVARLVAPDACLARQGKDFHGAARGADFSGLHRYSAVDRWKPIRIADHPYDLDLCDLCVRECPIDGAISLRPLAGPDDPRRTPIVAKSCVGCGVCEMMCPTTPAAIRVDVASAERAA
jgi:ferredoxin-type protein NapG